MTTDQPLLRRTLARMDEAWGTFSGRVHALPGELLASRIGDGGWTRRQMLAHIGTWHDLTVERLGRFGESGQPAELSEDEDVINARAARASDGRTTGELVLGMDDSYRRLRREVARLSDEKLAAHDGWAAALIAGNTYEHYAGHLDELGVRPA